MKPNTVDINELVRAYKLLKLKHINLTNELYAFNQHLSDVVKFLLNQYNIKWVIDSDGLFSIQIDTTNVLNNPSLKTILTFYVSDNCNLAVVIIEDWVKELDETIFISNELNFGQYINIMDFEKLLIKLNDIDHNKNIGVK